MFNSLRNKDLHELVCQSVKKDQDTFSCEIEKELFLCMLNHFFTINDFKDFIHWDIDSETYDQFYREMVSFKFWDMDMEELEFVVADMENQNEN